MSALMRPVGPQPPRVYWLRRAILLVAVIVLIALIVWVWPSGDGGKPTANDRPSAGQTPGDGGENGDEDGSGGPDDTITGEPGGPRDGSDGPDGSGGSGGSGSDGSGGGAGGAGGGGDNGSGGGSGASGGGSGAGSGKPGSSAGSSADSGSADGGSGDGGTSGAGSGPAKSATVCADSKLRLRAQASKDAVKVGADLPVKLTVENLAKQACEVKVDPEAMLVTIDSGADRIWDTNDCPKTLGPATLTLKPGKPRAVSVTWPGIRSGEGCSSDGPKGTDAVKTGYYEVALRIGDMLSPAGRFRVI